MQYFETELSEIVEMLSHAESDEDIITAYKKYMEYANVDGFIDAVGDEPPIITLVDIYHSIVGE